MKRYILAGLLIQSMAVAMAQGDPNRAFDPAPAAVRRAGTTVRIDLIGVSTQTDHAGYGRCWRSGHCGFFDWNKRHMRQVLGPLGRHSRLSFSLDH